MNGFKQFKMTKVQHDRILKACQPVPAIALQCGQPQSVQESANAAWRALGEELDFDYATARPVAGKPDDIFEAVKL